MYASYSPRTLNAILAVSNIAILYPIYMVHISGLAIEWMTPVYLVLGFQGAASVAQHVTEQKTSDHGMSGWLVVSYKTERMFLILDRFGAAMTTGMFGSIVVRSIGTSFLFTINVPILIGALSLIVLSDTGYVNQPIRYTVIHLMWHISIYGFLGNVLRTTMTI
jgi:hypothetical protein